MAVDERANRKTRWVPLTCFSSLVFAARVRMHPSSATPVKPISVPYSSVNWPRRSRYASVTASVFAEAPLAALEMWSRNQVLSDYARLLDADEHPGAVIEKLVDEKPPSNGWNARLNDLDWTRDDRKVACRIGQLTWKVDRWRVRFPKVLVMNFDEVFLVVYTPEGLHLFKFETKGSSVEQSSTDCGEKVFDIMGSREEEDWRTALADILDKLLFKAPHFASTGFAEPRLRALIEASPPCETGAAYFAKPLADVVSQSRGEVITSIVRQLEKDELYPGAVISEASPTEDPWDWLRDEKRVAHKSAQFMFRQKRWCVIFANLPAEDAYDELLLTLYTPEGMHIFRCNRHPSDIKAGNKNTGKVPGRAGKKQVTYSASGGTKKWPAALQEVLDKIESHGHERIAVLPWDSGVT